MVLLLFMIWGKVVINHFSANRVDVSALDGLGVDGANLLVVYSIH